MNKPDCCFLFWLIHLFIGLLMPIMFYLGCKHGQFAAIVCDRMSQKRVYLVSLSNPKEKKLILKLGPKVEETFDDSYPLVAFHPYAPLLTCYFENKGQRMLMLYNIDEDSKEFIKIESVDKVTSISYSPAHRRGHGHGRAQAPRRRRA